MYIFHINLPQPREVISQEESVIVYDLPFNELIASNLSKAFIELESNEFVVTKITMNNITKVEFLRKFCNKVNVDRIWTAKIIVDNKLSNNEFNLFTDL